MVHSLKKLFRFLKDLSIHFSRDFLTYFYKGWQAGLMGAYANSFARSLIFYLNQFRIYLYINGIQHHHIREEKMKRLQKTANGLHALLSRDICFTYSILMPVNQPDPLRFGESLESALNQSAPHTEILIGLMHIPSKQLNEVLKNICQKSEKKIQVFRFYQTLKRNEVINQLAERASGQFLFILGEEDWMRPDSLLRCEQTLRIFPDPEKMVLYSNVNQINDKGYFIPNSEYRQLNELHFPFFFKPFFEKGLLFPNILWKQGKGIDVNCKGAEYENLLLKFDLAGARFQHIPLALYSTRASCKQDDAKTREMFLQSLENYSKAKNLNWVWTPGYQSHSVRAIPPISTYFIQVVIPYKDQKELTLKCVQSLFKQVDVQFQITAVDNCSTDLSIAQEIEQLGGEVISIHEPFNYSRLNNLAVQLTQKATHCDVLLFLNNDVELEPDALCEMLRWIDQPQVGMVGCRLHYPDGRLQHGGVRMNRYGREEMRWEHIEKLRVFEEMNESKTLGFFDAVTAACAMIKRKTFLDVGGFDEIWYPIGYSDTNLAVKIAKKGLKSFYTPYAVGVHHESVSRKSSIEDYESSWWLHHLVMRSENFSGPSL